MDDLKREIEAKQEKLNKFKEYAVSHPHLAKVDKSLMGAITEPAGFAHVLVYGPSGVGKTTMINQIARRLNGSNSTPSISNQRGRKKDAKEPNPHSLMTPQNCVMPLKKLWPFGKYKRLFWMKHNI
jgi:putative ribosome biogenesis GTPase RsgA